MLLEFAILCLFPWAISFGASMDLFTMTIPNRVSVIMVVGFLLLAPFMGFGWAGFVSHLGAGAAMLVIGVIMFSLGWLGGGDAKLFAASALWVGFEFLLEFTFFITLAGGALTLAILWFRQTIPHPLIIKQRWAMHLHHPQTGIPYGIAIAASALLIYPDMPWALAFRG